MGIFDFLKPKKKLSPEEVGEAMALVFCDQFVPKMQDYVREFGGFPEITKQRLDDLFYLYLMYWSTAISLEIELSDIYDDDKKIILDYFWNYIPEILRDCYREHKTLADEVSSAFERNTELMYPKIRELLLSPPETFQSTIAFPRMMMQVAIPTFEVSKDNVDVLHKLMGDLYAIRGGMTGFVKKSLEQL